MWLNRSIRLTLLGLAALGLSSAMAEAADLSPGPKSSLVRIEAESFIAHLDSDTINQGGAGPNTGVDVAPIEDHSSELSVGWTTDGEWLEYLVTVPQDGLYELRARVSAAFFSGALEVAVDGQPMAMFDVDDGKGFQHWVTMKPSSLWLEKGTRRVRVTWLDGANINLNWLELVKSSSGRMACSGLL